MQTNVTTGMRRVSATPRNPTGVSTETPTWGRAPTPSNSPRASLFPRRREEPGMPIRPGRPSHSASAARRSIPDASLTATRLSNRGSPPHALPSTCRSCPEELLGGVLTPQTPPPRPWVNERQAGRSDLGPYAGND